MLIPTSFQPLVEEESCYMGVTVMGGVLNQFASSLAMLSHCKFLGSAHYTIAKDTQFFFGSVPFTNWIGFSPSLDKSVKNYKFFYASTPLSEWVCVIFQYAASLSSALNSPQITISVKDLSGTKLSKDVLFVYPRDLQMLIDGNLATPFVGTTGVRFYDVPSGTTGTDDPRPLYIPPANRGDMLMIEIFVEDCDLVSLTMLDLYQAEVTP